MRILSTCLVLAALSVPAALAQTAPSTSSATAMPPCSGVLAIIRVSEITPNGSMEKFMAAVAAQKAWYQSHGLGDQIFASRILVRDPNTNAFVYSDKEALSYHFISSNAPSAPNHDAAWDAFVKLFQDTSTIKQSALTCVPKAMAPTPGS